MEKVYNTLQYIVKSKFVRAIFFRIITVFLIVILALSATLYYLFSSQVNRAVVSDTQKQLDSIESTISERMQEVTSIAYNIGQDSAFLLSPVEDAKYSGYEMSTILSRYLVGNGFIKYLAYYRLAEPDVVYSSNGELTFHQFWNSYLQNSNYSENDYLEQIKASTGASFIPGSSSTGGVSYFTYIYSLPQFSTDPQAFVIALIPNSEIESQLALQLGNSVGEVAIFDASGKELYRYSTIDQSVVTVPSGVRGTAESYVSSNGAKYVVQEAVSNFNGWTIVSAVRLGDVVSGIATTQILVIVAMILMMLVAVWIILTGVINKYKPISNLALTLTDPDSMDASDGVIDEKSLLTDTIATLKIDSAEKQRFEDAYLEAAAASKAKSAFLSSMSHDIRTPMNAIIGMNSLAIKHIDDTEYVRDCLSKAGVASQYLLDIINNVLDMSRIESGRIVLAEERIDLPKLIHSLITINYPSTKSKKLRFLVETENIRNETLIGDSVRLTQVCMNILSNAIKFTPEGGTIQMGVEQVASTDEGYGDYILTFADTGMGMEPEFVGKVFDTFSRATTPGISQIEGTGLGMAIAKNFVELMGGTITCESEIGHGTTFTVRLKMRLADDDFEKRVKTCADAHRSERVLLIGDDERLLAQEASLFESFGVVTQQAFGFNAACEMLRESPDAPYELALINLCDNTKASDYYPVTAVDTGGNTRLALVAMDFAGLNQSSAVDNGVEAFVHTPLFRSTVIDLLDGAYSLRHKVLPPSDTIVDLTGKRVLLVEDNAMNREIARRIICETQAEVVDATNGKEAVDIFAAHEEGYFDVILMDLQMPVLDGYGATAAIRAIRREDAAVIPIYAMTANTFDEDVRQVREAGMNGHLGKPYTPEDLYEVLAKAVGISH